MSQTAITYVFEQWKAQQAAEGVDVVLDEFVFAHVPGLDPSLPVDRAEVVPTEHVVYRQKVTQTGRMNDNAVVYSVVLDASTGDFSFNWLGLVNRESDTLAMVVHAPEQQKTATKEGQQGNTLTRSFLMEYNGAATETAINTPAETWQIDFTARLAGMDERQRLENIDIYGEAAFFGDGWLITKAGTGYVATPGAGYAKGLRAQLNAELQLQVDTLPVTVWLDVCWAGALTSTWQTECSITLAVSLDDYERDGTRHYVVPLASIDADGTVTDLRPKGSLSDQQANNDFVRKDKNLSDLDDAAKSRKNLQLGNIATHDEGDFVSSAGGSVGYLDGAEHYATREQVWPGKGAFANQLADRRALFYSQGFTSQGNEYYPLIKGTVQTAGAGYLAATSFGILSRGGNQFPVPCIHSARDDGNGAIWQFDPNNNAFRSPGNVYAGEAALGTNADVYGTAWGGWLSTWLGNNTVTPAYVNQRIQDVQNWTSQNFISSMDLTAPVEVVFDGNWGWPKTTDGAHVYNLSMVGGDYNRGTLVFRYQRYYRNGQWITLN